MMARYDRLAPLESPGRERSFPGWSVLRDLEGRERDADTARRARLRFLALRPVLRLTHTAEINELSYATQVDGVREELGQLPVRDPERARLARFLDAVRGRDPELLVTALTSFAESAAAVGQLFAAEEYANASVAIAQRTANPSLRCRALRRRAAVSRLCGRPDQALLYSEQACAAAMHGDDHGEWVRAMAELAAAQRASGDPAAATETVGKALTRAREVGDERLIAIAQSRQAAHALELGDAVAAVESAWTALRAIDDPAERLMLLRVLGEAFGRLGLHKAAQRTYSIVAQRAPDPSARASAAAHQALHGALAGDVTAARSRREQLLKELNSQPLDAPARARVQLVLGQAGALIGDVDFAREHLRDAITVARREALADVLSQAEEVLSILERKATPQPAAVTQAPVAARRIADELETLGDALIRL